MKYPNFLFEHRLWKSGYRFIAGVDEVGRGCFAGPVVAGCVVFPENRVLPLEERVTRGGGPQIYINDSKKLTPKQREQADKWIRKNATSWGVGEASVSQINRLGIKKATEIAFRKAIHKTSIKTSGIEYLLIDAFYIPYVKGLRRKNQKAMIKGDTKSISIAAASIVAKVYRDKLMTKLGKRPKYRKYGWAKNKGYGTLKHRKAIKKHGITRLHRKTFVETWLTNAPTGQASLKNSSSSPVR